MALLINGLLRLKHFRFRNSFINVSDAIKTKFTVNNNFEANRSLPVHKGRSFDTRRDEYTPNKWVKGMTLEDMPSYIFWPAQNRYGKILWWGYGSTGLFFIEKGKGYGYAGTKEVFHPATELDYLNYIQKNAE